VPILVDPAVPDRALEHPGAAVGERVLEGGKRGGTHDVAGQGQEDRSLERL